MKVLFLMTVTVLKYVITKKSSIPVSLLMYLLNCNQLMNLRLVLFLAMVEKQLTILS